MTRVTLLVGSAVLVLSCANAATNIVLTSLERSEKIDLFCADVEQLTGNLFDFRQVLPLELCDEDVTFAEDVNASFLGSVTQTEAGTLAVVNFTNGAIFDTNRTVPGVTALTVGEQPTAVQVSSVDSRYTYVTSFSAKSVQAVSTREVITGDPSPNNGDPVLPREEIRFDAGPQDLALYELATFEATTQTVDGEEQVTGATTEVAFRYLYAAIPELGQVVEIRVDVDDATGQQTLGTPTFFALPTLGCSAVTPVEPPVSDDTDYNRICPEDFDDRGEGRFIKTVATTVPCEDGPAPGPSPVGLAVDMGRPDDFTDDVLLVADANQPVIHRLGLSDVGASELEPLVSLAPTTEIVVTPFVPASSDPEDRVATERYLYAITGNDASVLAIDYTPTSETFGAVLPVLAGINARATEEGVEARNRVRSGFSNARAIEVLSPFYELEVDEQTGDLVIPENGDDDTGICNPEDDEQFGLAQNTRNFRGVFLGVSLSSGQMFYLDIYDLNAPCRGGQGAIACTLAETGPDQFASIRRHRRRFGFTPTTFIDIDGQTSLQFNESPGVIDEANGEAQASDGPGLELIDCPVSQFSVFGPNPDNDAEGYICSSSQVWSTFTQRWDARWQGVIPASDGGLGLFSDQSFGGEPGNWFLAGDVPFCEVGVLGEQDGSAIDSGLSIDQLPAYGGDRLVIIGELPLSTRDDEDCTRVFEDLEEDLDERQIWFPIIRAFNDELEIGPSPNPDQYTLEQTARCFNQFTQYQVNTRNVYTVTGTDSEFIHRVVPDPDTGECIFDESRPIVTDPIDVDTFLTARAFEGTQFINPLVSFEITEFGEGLVITDATIALLSFNILNQFGFELLDTGGNTRSLPGSMLFAPENDQLFFVDFDAGVRRIIFDPLNIVQTFD